MAARMATSRMLVLLAHAATFFNNLNGCTVENIDTFARDVALLETLCKNPLIILHTRGSVDDELAARIISNSEQALTTRLQWACFEAFLGNQTRAFALGSKEVLEGCTRITPLSSGTPVFRHTLEDYLEQTPNHLELWNQLGLVPPPKKAGCCWAVSASRACRRP